MMFSRRDWCAMIVGWSLGAIVGGGVVWFDVNLVAAGFVLGICTFLATLAMVR